MIKWLWIAAFSCLAQQAQGDSHNNIGNATCAAVDQCSNLVGDCCPSASGADLFCCDTTPGSCAINPNCVDANVTGDCCPTVQNVFLDCCDRPFAQCAAHPYCTHLAGDCCPTTSGVFLDCCQDDRALQNITFPANDTAALCAANQACAGLDGACCPTVHGVYLYCCGEAPRTSDYQIERTLVSPSIPEPLQLAYLISSSPYRIGSSAGTTGTPPSSQSVIYERNSSEVFDLIYYQTGGPNAVITNATEFVVGAKKFYINMWTDAPNCTQILLQLDNLPIATPDNFPTGRHSRYITFTTKQQEWERMEFDYLDSLDQNLNENQINAVALFLNPGSTDEYTFYFDFLDVTESGCTSNCEEPSIKNCPAYFGGEDEDGLPPSTTPGLTTAMPTYAPTSQPTNQPTFGPTSTPTNGPTFDPTTQPTDGPTGGPTLSPTFAPTSNPTSAPTGAPTTSPTSVPTAGPTSMPVVGTANPTEIPLTNSPTDSPTTQPTNGPTNGPSMMPTRNPTDSPTSVPTTRPTVGPTAGTTSQPTNAPTDTPTDKPTLVPTDIPTTRAPTAEPTREPTFRPLYLWDAPACADGIDNDGDGYKDCSDPDCCLTVQCWVGWRRSYTRATYQLSTDDDSTSSSTGGDDNGGGPQSTLTTAIPTTLPPSKSANPLANVFLLLSLISGCVVLWCVS